MQFFCSLNKRFPPQISEATIQAVAHPFSVNLKRAVKISQKGQPEEVKQIARLLTTKRKWIEPKCREMNETHVHKPSQNDQFYSFREFLASSSIFNWIFLSEKNEAILFLYECV